MSSPPFSPYPLPPLFRCGGGCGRRRRGGWTPDYVDIREDRIVLYGTVTSSVSSFTYRARAINSGNFTTPALFAEAMYDKTVWALRPQAPIRVVK